MVERFCTGLGHWEEPDYSQCPSMTGCELREIEVCFLVA